MSFFSLYFCFYYLFVFLVYNAVSCRFKHYVLLAASIVFYALFDLKYTMVLLLIILLSYCAARGIEADRNGKHAKTWFCVGIGVCIAVLAFFKFWNYVYSAAIRIFGAKDLASSGAVVIVAPIGISFFALEAIGYMVDVYKGTIKAERDFAKYALFISFFPKIMSGPIDRSTNLLKQIRKGVTFDYDNIKHSFLLILWGSFIKLLIANRLAVVVDTAFKTYNEQTGFTMLIAVVLYGMQLYVDFAGYSFIAIGLAGTFGYKLVDNFIQPYFAVNIRDFWRRWHVSLSSWLRDYVYIPLGGSRKGKVRKCINLIITFLVSGIWHGTGWHFVLWGLIHGFFQVGAVLLERIKIKNDPDRFSNRLIRAVITFALVDFAWLFFRADSIGSSLEILHKIVLEPEVGRTIHEGLCLAGVEVKKGGVLLFEILLLFIVDMYHEKGIRVSAWLDKQDKWFRWSIYVMMSLFIIIGMIRDYGIDASSFIYATF